MARTPRNVLVFPFRRMATAGLEFAVFRRADDPGEFWQGVAGGVEDGETVLEAARRELAEETGIEAPAASWLTLDSQASIPATVYRDCATWGPDTFIVREFAFGVDVGAAPDVRLSHEHAEHRWVGLDEAQALVRYDSNRTALWELGERLSRAAALTAARQPEAPP
jgi:dATP pyrophosphohydrolase